ncbi:amidohydrolase family protein [Nocardioides sp. 1609]|uniref:amidohydrolase family protein n=1 Tax=Nocardioides sp. 1609 TaxID=2508327 RepID=UPI00107022A6|nr:amidohydrolase family protein [Nocardioides sp. 1609]
MVDSAPRIDTHHHFVAPEYRRYLEGKGYFGGQAIPAWSPEASLDLMGRLGIGASVLSTARPGFYFGNRSEARAIAREVNEYAADLVTRRPKEFGLLAGLPLPNVDDALEEIVHSFDVLGCDGVVMLASQEGTYLGDPSLDPLLEELDRRSAVLFVHPNALPEAPPLQDVPVFIADFLLDTTRAALNLVRHGCVRRYPRIKFLLSHGGGFLPYAAHRIASLTPTTADGPPNREEFLADCREFYFDTALTASPSSLPSLMAFAQPGRITYGSDYPYAGDGQPEYFTNQLDSAGLDDHAAKSISSEAAKSLFPRLA